MPWTWEPPRVTSTEPDTLPSILNGEDPGFNQAERTAHSQETLTSSSTTPLLPRYFIK